MPDDLLDGEQGKVTVADLVEKAEEEKESETVEEASKKSEPEQEKVEEETNGVAAEAEEEEVAAPVEAEEAPLTQVILLAQDHTLKIIHEMVISSIRLRSRIPRRRRPRL